MAVRKPAPKVTAKDLLRADAARRARPPQRDPTGEHHEACAELARECGVKVDDVLDDWDHAAAIIEYERGADRDTAERVAMEQTRAMYQRRRAS